MSWNTYFKKKKLSTLTIKTQTIFLKFLRWLNLLTIISKSFIYFLIKSRTINKWYVIKPSKKCCNGSSKSYHNYYKNSQILPKKLIHFKKMVPHTLKLNISITVLFYYFFVYKTTDSYLICCHRRVCIPFHTHILKELLICKWSLETWKRSMHYNRNQNIYRKNYLSNLCPFFLSLTFDSISLNISFFFWINLQNKKNNIIHSKKRKTMLK